MSVLWCGGEDIDFPNGTGVAISTLSTYARTTTYSRCGVGLNAAGLSKSTTFPGGAVTSCWLTFRLGNSGTGSTSTQIFGLGASGTVKGIFLGTAAAGGGSKLAISKYDGVTRTELAAEAGTSLAVNTLRRIDVNLVNYGATSTIDVYMDGAILISFSGDSSIGGVSGFDSIFLAGNGACFWYASEIIVADEDLRAWPGLMTLAPTVLGTTDQWTLAAVGNINGTTISDANPASINTNDQEEQFNVTDLVAGTFTIKAVKIAVRAAKSSGSTPTQIALGYKNGSNVSVGSDIPLTTAYATYERLDPTDPTTSTDWLQADMNGLQIEVKSRA